MVNVAAYDRTCELPLVATKHVKNKGLGQICVRQQMKAAKGEHRTRVCIGATVTQELRCLLASARQQSTDESKQ